MRLTATEIRQQQFAMRFFRGFDPQEVDAFLEEMADDVEELTRENALLKEQLLTVEEKSRAVEAREKTLQVTLVTTQKIS
jgi:cell division initiation protein